MRAITKPAIIAVLGIGLWGANQVCAGELLNYFLQQHREEAEQRSRNEATRLELERLDLEQKLRYRRASDPEISQELMRYCPNGEPPCRQQPPDLLLQEASRRGLIILSPPGRPSGVAGSSMDGSDSMRRA
jgi:hypothetical protein